MSFKVLIVENSIEMSDLIHHCIKESCMVTASATLQDSIRLVEKNKYDLIILDIELPDGDGFQAYTKIRQLPHLKDSIVVFLTARDTTQDKIMGYSIGIDDYITKPFDYYELRIRLESKLKRLQRNQKDRQYIDHQEAIRIDCFSHKAYIFDSNKQMVDLNLTKIEFQLLFCFMSNPEKILTREYLLDKVWGNKSHVVDRVIDIHIGKLRKKLQHAGECIKTSYGNGYILVPYSSLKQSA